MAKPTEAPYIKARRGMRSYALGISQVDALRVDGPHWMLRRCGVVVYVNDSLEDSRLDRIHLSPRNLLLEAIPGFYPPPEAFSTLAPGCWAIRDWVTMPKKFTGDPFIVAVHRLRRVFYHLRLGPRSRHMRAFDIWPQEGKIIWPWEPARLKP